MPSQFLDLEAPIHLDWPIGQDGINSTPPPLSSSHHTSRQSPSVADPVCCPLLGRQQHAHSINYQNFLRNRPEQDPPPHHPSCLRDSVAGLTMFQFDLMGECRHHGLHSIPPVSDGGGGGGEEGGGHIASVLVVAAEDTNR